MRITLPRNLKRCGLKDNKMPRLILTTLKNALIDLGNGLSFLKSIVKHLLKGHIRINEVSKQIYEQGVQSLPIIILTSLATGVVLALQGIEMLIRFGAKDLVAQGVSWGLVREMSPLFTAIIFSAKAGAKITAELGTMTVNDQILATRALGVDPVEFLIVPRILACFLVVPILTIISEIVGIFGGYCVGTLDANIPGAYYLAQTFKTVRYVDFFSGFGKVFIFAILIGWICCYQGFFTKGGSLGVGKYTAQAVAYSIIFVILSNTVLTKLMIMLWG